MAKSAIHFLNPYSMLGVGGMLVLCACAGAKKAVNTNELSPSPPPIVDRGVTLFEGKRAFEHVKNQMAFGPRIVGSQGNKDTRVYIENTLLANGWTVADQSFEHEGIQLTNVIAKSSEKPLECIIGAHFDTRSVADQDPTSPNSPVPGANDGASGVAVLLELARVVDLSPEDKSIWMLFFDAEDNGNLGTWEWATGASYFASAMQVDPACVIVVDMVGDIDQQFYYEVNSDRALQSKLWRIADTLGYSEYFVQESKYSMLDDHIPFVQKGIPSVDVIDFDYQYWHTTNDTLDKISSISLERVGRVLEYFFEHNVYP